MRPRTFQLEPLRRADELGMMLLLWRRQAGKTSLFAWQALKWMLRFRGCLVTLVSASLNVGRELTEKEASVFAAIISDLRLAAEAQGLRLETSADTLIREEKWDDYLDLMDKSRLEVRLWHTNTISSRTIIIAPNVATARGYSGFVLMDEIGFVRDFQDIWGAVEPIASSNPDFRIWFATTPPDDDSHYSWELSAPEPGTEFPVSAKGNWYVSQRGIPVHRLDAWDAETAGVHLYDLNTRLAITPDESRARATDRAAWDRNYALKFQIGGTAACGILQLQHAMEAGAQTCVAVEDDFPPNWRDLLVPDAPTAVGADPATTEREKSNPFSITIGQQIDGRARLVLIIRFKTKDPLKAKAYLAEACDLGGGRRPKRLVIDATNEKYWAAEVKREMSSICPVDLIVSSEVTEYLGERMTWKAKLGNMMVNALDDGHVEMANVRWLKDDWRLVLRVKGSFDNALDSEGNHGDTFDSSKNTLFGLEGRGGPVEAQAVAVGNQPGPAEPRDRLSMRPNHDDGVSPAERIPL